MSLGDAQLQAARTADWRDVAYGVGKVLLLAFYVAMIVLPFLYIISVSFRTQAEVFATDLYLIPRDPSLEAWRRAFDILDQNLWWSAQIATGTAILSLLISVPGGYVFGRKDFRFKEIAFLFLILSLLFPHIVLVVPIADMWNAIGLYNTLPGLWIAYQAFITPFAVWILRDFFRKLPENLEESAQVYGCTQFSAFVRVVLPLATPGIIAVGFLAFLTGWNEFIFANMITTGSGPRPAVVVLYSRVVGTERTFWAELMAQSLIIGTPPFVLYMFARRYLTEAFAFG